ncbi:MAG: single-stranded-DNA-specific exonuclease RecJ [Candidatus Babeliales bacterium]
MQKIHGLKYLWKLPERDQPLLFEVASRYNLSIPIAQMLISRGFTSPEQLDAYLFSSFERDVAHPSCMKDAQKAVDRIVYALENSENILIFGDYDVDGITSSAMMMRCLLPLGAQVNFFLPHRVKDGYGLSTKVVNRAADNGYKLIITVDNGITAFEPASMAKERSIDLIITDHHRPHDHLPDAFAIVNPNQIDCPYPFKGLAGVGVTFKLLSLLYEKKGLPLPSKVYELLLLGTIADVVPLEGENRFWVRHGLKHANTVESFALKTLKSNGRVVKPLMRAMDIGFSIAPQINALGRLEDPRQGVKFLIGSDEQEIEHVGKVLFELNEARKTIERTIFESIEQQILSGAINVEKENIIMAASDAWPPGVIGLVASRFVGKYGKPTILFHLTKHGLAKGSCRSITEFNMFNALVECKELLEQFGGHSAAAGLSLKQENLPHLKQRLEEIILRELAPEDLQQKLQLDAYAQLSDIGSKLVHDMDLLEPFAHKNAQPSFYIPAVTLVQKPVLLKDAHVKCSIFSDGVIKPIIFFNRPELFELFMQQETESFDVAVNVTENYWNGKTTIELLGIDVAGLQGKV